MDNRERDMGKKSRRPPHAPACARAGPPSPLPTVIAKITSHQYGRAHHSPFLMVSAHFVIFCPGHTQRVHGAGTPDHVARPSSPQQVTSWRSAKEECSRQGNGLVPGR